jgi:hypothetical protein
MAKRHPAPSLERDWIGLYDTGGSYPERGLEVFLYDDNGDLTHARIEYTPYQLVQLATELLKLAQRSDSDWTRADPSG